VNERWEAKMGDVETRVLNLITAARLYASIEQRYVRAYAEWLDKPTPRSQLSAPDRLPMLDAQETLLAAGRAFAGES
jgi:hypothetical protein